MEEVNLPPMEMFQALFEHRVSIEYSVENDDLTVCPIEGLYKGKCLIRLGLAQVLDAEVFIDDGKFRVVGDLRNCAQRNAEDLKTFKPSDKFQVLEIDNSITLNLGTQAEILVFKDRLYISSPEENSGDVAWGIQFAKIDFAPGHDNK